MPTTTAGMSATLGMVLLLLGLSVLIPGVIANTQSPQERTFDQDIDERKVITGDLTSRVTVITNQGEINVSVFNKKNGAFASTGELAEGENATLVFPGGNVTVTNVNTFNTNTAVVDYVYPLYLGWPDGAEVVINNSPLIILLSTLVMLIGLLFTIYDGVV